MKLHLTRPLVFFDLETTGTNVLRDRIVEISVVKLFPDGHYEEKTRRVNPGMPIPPGATAIHHISDDDVKDEPLFERIANSLLTWLDDCDIAGYNSNKFDVPLLIEEFKRANLKFDTSGRNFIDVQNIFHKMEQRTLVAAYRFYCGKELDGAHSASADTLATMEVLLGQLDRYPQLKGDVKSLADFSNIDRALDLAGRVVLNEKGEPIFSFGKHKGKTVEEIVKNEPSFLHWIFQGDFPENTKNVLRGLMYKYNPSLVKKKNNGTQG